MRLKKKLCKKSKYDQKYPSLKRGDLVYVVQYKWTYGEKRRTQLSGVGRIISIDKKVAYIIRLFKNNEIVSVARPYLRKATIEELFEI